MGASRRRMKSRLRYGRYSRSAGTGRCTASPGSPIRAASRVPSGSAIHSFSITRTGRGNSVTVFIAPFYPIAPAGLAASHLSGCLGAATARYPLMAGRPESQGQAVAHIETDIQIPAVNDRKTEAARRHRVGLERFVVPERDLDAGDLGILVDQLPDPGAVDFVAHAMRAKQDDAVTGAPILVFEAPDPFAVQRDDGVDPASAIEVGPLIGEPEVTLDDPAADRLEIDDAGIAIEALFEPPPAISLDLRFRLGMDCPEVEHASLERLAGVMPPPNRLSIDHGDVGAQVLPA